MPSVASAVIASMLLLALTAQSAAQVSEPFRRVRSIDPMVRERLYEGFRRSATFRQIVLELERTHVIVYITRGVCDIGRIAGCLLRFVKVAGTDRYLRIIVGAVVSGDRLIAVLGHELQHVREVADAPMVLDGLTMVALFRRTGLRECPHVRGECYETQAAMDAEDAILKELGKPHHFTRP